MSTTLADYTDDDPLAAPRNELAARLSRLAPTDGNHDTAIEQLHVSRATDTTQCKPTVYEPAIFVVAQGRKQALLDGEPYFYDPLHYLVVSVTLPVGGQIIEASAEKPFLGLRLSVDPRDVSALMLETDTRAVAANASIDRGLYSARSTAPLLDAVLRLLRLLDAPQDTAVLAPLAIREIYYRVLVGELGDRLRELATADSRADRVSRAIRILRTRYTESLRIDELAEAACMSASALHHHFKAVTAMSPLQFQKHLRLHEARRLMLALGLEANAAAHRVGYESASQFSREYKRLFGAPPKQEIDRLREAEIAA
ncbi:AraC family transcriptional regulator [Solimonas marina]|uniref:AraC family transcriptional regulator n=1 Tax=Solimonas marina TaxID=2714601 RepID=A0A970B9H2_9GAMM|nr:AraC family transcriptional regulator [Solimonas marina]NKF22386.1 AraC family transcriptional regulator [Solimonas marina]